MERMKKTQKCKDNASFKKDGIADLLEGVYGSKRRNAKVEFVSDNEKTFTFQDFIADLNIKKKYQQLEEVRGAPPVPNPDYFYFGFSDRTDSVTVKINNETPEHLEYPCNWYPRDKTFKISKEFMFIGLQVMAFAMDSAWELGGGNDDKVIHVACILEKVMNFMGRWKLPSCGPGKEEVKQILDFMSGEKSKSDDSGRLKECDDQKNELQRKLDECISAEKKGATSEIQSDLIKCRGELSELINLNESQTERILNLEEEVEKLKSLNASKLEDYNKLISCEADLKTLTNTIKNHNNDIKSLEEANEALEADKVKLQKDLTLAKNQLEADKVKLQKDLTLAKNQLEDCLKEKKSNININTLNKFLFAINVLKKSGDRYLFNDQYNFTKNNTSFTTINWLNTILSMIPDKDPTLKNILNDIIDNLKKKEEEIKYLKENKSTYTDLDLHLRSQSGYYEDVLNLIQQIRDSNKIV
jgi:hypothetical protein